MSTSYRISLDFKPRAYRSRVMQEDLILHSEETMEKIGYIGGKTIMGSWDFIQESRVFSSTLLTIKETDKIRHQKAKCKERGLITLARNRIKVWPVLLSSVIMLFCRVSMKLDRR